MLEKKVLFLMLVAMIVVGCDNNNVPKKHDDIVTTSVDASNQTEMNVPKDIEPTVSNVHGKIIVAGIVKSTDGNPIIGAEVAIGNSTVKTNDAGAYRIDVPEESFPVPLKVFTNGYVEYETELNKKEYYDNIEVVLKPNEISGFIFERPHTDFAVVDKPLRIPAAYLKNLKIEIGHKTSDGEIIKPIVLESNGSFKVFGFPTGPVWIKITSPNFATHLQAMSVRKPQHSIEVVLKPNLYIARAVDTANNFSPIEGAMISIDGEKIATNVSGDAIFNHIATGLHKIEVYANGYKKITDEVIIDKNHDSKIYSLEK